MTSTTEQINIRMSASMDSDQAVQDTKKIGDQMDRVSESSKQAAEETKQFARQSSQSINVVVKESKSLGSVFGEIIKGAVTIGAGLLTLQVRSLELKTAGIKPVTSSFKDLAAEMKKALGNFGKFGRTIGKVGGALTKIIKKIGIKKLLIAGLVIGVIKLTKAIVTAFIDKLAKASQSIATFSTSMDSIKSATAAVAEEFDGIGESAELASERMKIIESLVFDLSDASGKSSEDIAKFIAQLTNIGVSQQEAVHATTAALNISVNEGRDLKEVMSAIRESYKGSSSAAQSMGLAVKGLSENELKRGGLVDKIQKRYGEQLETSKFILTSEIKRALVEREIKKTKAEILTNTKTLRNIWGHLVTQVRGLAKTLWEITNFVLTIIDKTAKGIGRIGQTLGIIVSTTYKWIHSLLTGVKKPVKDIGDTFKAIQAVMSGDWKAFDKIIGSRTKEALNDYADRLAGLADEAANTITKVEVVNGSDLLGLARGFAGGLRDNDDLLKLVRSADPFGFAERYKSDESLLNAVLSVANYSEETRDRLVEILGVEQRRLDLEKDKDKASKKKTIIKKRKEDPLDLSGILGAANAINQAAAQEKYLDMLLKKSRIGMTAKQLEAFAASAPDKQALQDIIQKLANTIQRIADKAEREANKEDPLDMGGILGAATAINQAASQEKYLNMLLKKSKIGMTAKELEAFAASSPDKKALQDIIQKLAGTIQRIADRAEKKAEDNEKRRKAKEAEAFRKSITVSSILGKARENLILRSQRKEFNDITQSLGLGTWREVRKIVRDSLQGIDPLSKSVGKERGQGVVANFIRKKLEKWLVRKERLDKKASEFARQTSEAMGTLGSFINFLNQGAEATVKPEDFSADPKEKLNQILSNINNGIEQAKTAIAKGVTKAITVAVPALKPFEKQLGPIVKGIINILEDPDSIESFWHNFSAGVGILMEKVSRNAHKLLLFVPKLGNIFIAALIRGIPGVFKSIIYFVPNLIEELVTEGGRLLDLMVESLKQMITNIAYEIRDLVTNAIPNAAQDAGNWISDKWGGFTDWVSGTAADPGATASGAWANITEAANNAGTAIGNLGKERYTIDNEKIAGAPADLTQKEYFEQLLKTLEAIVDDKDSQADAFHREIKPYVIEGVSPQKISGVDRTDETLTAAEAFNPYFDEGKAREKQPVRIQIQIANSRLREILTDLDESGYNRVVSI